MPHDAVRRDETRRNAATCTAPQRHCGPSRVSPRCDTLRTRRPAASTVRRDTHARTNRIGSRPTTRHDVTRCGAAWPTPAPRPDMTPASVTWNLALTRRNAPTKPRPPRDVVLRVTVRRATRAMLRWASRFAAPSAPSAPPPPPARRCVARHGTPGRARDAALRVTGPQAAQATRRCASRDAAPRTRRCTAHHETPRHPRCAARHAGLRCNAALRCTPRHVARRDGARHAALVGPNPRRERARHRCRPVRPLLTVRQGLAHGDCGGSNGFV